MPHEIEAVRISPQGLNRVPFANFKETVSALANGCCETERAHGAKISKHGHGVRRAISSGSAGLESKRDRRVGCGQKVTWKIVVQRVRLETSQLDMVVICQRSRVRYRNLRRSCLGQCIRGKTVVHSWVRQVVKGVPAHEHASITGVRQANLGVHGGIGGRGIGGSIGGECLEQGGNDCSQDGWEARHCEDREAGKNWRRNATRLTG